VRTASLANARNIQQKVKYMKPMCMGGARLFKFGIQMSDGTVADPSWCPWLCPNGKGF
jgi:hypothetical protein